MIPFLDLHKINARFEAKFQDSFQSFMDSGHYILGTQLDAFENAFAAFCGTKHCIGVGNGLDALRLILEAYKALGKVKEGDEVLVASNTFVATILAIKQAGLTPVLVEAETTYFSFNTSALKEKISQKTKVIMPVHLYGQIAPMEALLELANTYNLYVIEDAAQAHGAMSASGKRAGSIGVAAGFSFYPTKNLGALGDGGAITTQDDALAAMIRKLRNYGTSSKYVNEEIGFNSRLDEVQASFLLEKLKYLDTDNKARQSIAAQYLSEIKNTKITLPNWDGTQNHVFHLFVVRVLDREGFMKFLKDHEIGCLIHYPIPPHHQKAFPEFSQLSFPVSEKIHKQVVSLPMSPVMDSTQVKRVIEVINRY
ncbi:MAG: aminotransferase [Alteromonas sp.]|nr:aminotransferase [Alteromonas sp.]MAY21560.1 aminotransferase [Flavobacteriaceae bacterium]|tara:strand:- start:31038 stop:32138 length:1101 start_codon:yes stop_codon:yes gene_type:complete